MQFNQFDVSMVIGRAFKDLRIYQDHKSFDSIIWTLAMLGLADAEDYKFWTKA